MEKGTEVVNEFIGPYHERMRNIRNQSLGYLTNGFLFQQQVSISQECSPFFYFLFSGSLLYLLHHKEQTGLWCPLLFQPIYSYRDRDPTPVKEGVLRHLQTNGNERNREPMGGTL